jgi:hypothetical protein
LSFTKSKFSETGAKEAENAANLISFRAKLKARELPAIDKWVLESLSR